MKTKYVPHRSCSCRSCKRGRATKSGQAVHSHTERRYRRAVSRQLRSITQGVRDLDSFDAVLVSTPFTD